ncbi:hypothetical protein FRC20_007324 [Serendipita sp. 405]|nr:hypothetical protein FRC15_007235 [Serendipita sp. 397]KAG8835168.1 hypothetical protein FRC20_007324 [Serendipita sp. 405]
MNTQKAPKFPVPDIELSNEDDLTRKMREMRFGPPSGPPPGWGGGFNPTLPLQELFEHDPYLRISQAGDNKPLPPLPPPSWNIGPGRVVPAPPMPLPAPYHPSKSDTALAPGKFNRRVSAPIPQSPVDSSPDSPSYAKAPRTMRRRSGSEEGDVQCSGTTKQGKQCTRKVKTAPPFSFNLDPQDTTTKADRYCFQHTKEILSQPGFFPPDKPSVDMVSFDTWIAPELQEDTKTALRVEMAKPLSSADQVDGYIYCYQIINPDTPDHVHLKVGRSVNFISRVNQWERQCRSKSLVLRGCWPSVGNGIPLKGKMEAGEKGPHINRLERLVHLHLADIAKNAPYLESIPDVGTSQSASAPDLTTTNTPRRKRAKDVDVSMSGKPCPDCGRIHREIFTFPKAKGKLENAEWEKIVLPVIQTWGLFVEQYL